MAHRSIRAGLGLAIALGLLGMIPGVALAANPACGDTLMSDTTLSANMDCSGYAGNALIIGKSGVTLNLNGYKITGDGSNDVIDVEYFRNVVIKNGRIDSDGDDGIHLYYSSSAKIKNIRFINGNYGIDMEYGGGHLIKNNTFVGGGGAGENIDALYGASNRFIDNVMDASGTSECFYVYYENRDLFQGNTCTSFADEGAFYDYESNGNRWIDNTATDGEVYGFYFECDEHGTVTAIGNVVDNVDGYGFYIYECHNLGGDTEYPPYLPGTGSVFKNNTVTNNSDDGFYSYWTANATWTGNVANDNGGDGFDIDYPYGNEFTDNTAKRNDGDGFYFDDNETWYSYNVWDFSDNVAKKNGGYGFYADDAGMPGANNLARMNDFPAPYGNNCYNAVCI